MVKRLLFILLTIILFNTCNTIDSNYTNKVDFKRTFEGKTEDKEVKLSMTHIDSKIKGELSFQNLNFFLEGELNKRGKFELKVIDSSGGQNGIIKGKLKNGDVVKATWTEIEGNREHELSLNLTESSTPTDFNQIYKMTSDWSKNINAKDFQLIANSYNDTITFYTELRPKEYCIKLKMKYIEKYPDYRQIIDRTIIVTEYKNGIIKSEFNKTMFRNKEERTYPSYLLFKRFENEIKIIEEGDMLTNTNLNKSLDLGEIERTETLDHYSIKEIPTESSFPMYLGLLFLIGSASGVGIYYFKRKKKRANKTISEKDSITVVEKEVIIEKEVIVEKEVIIEVSSDRNLSESEIKGLEFEKYIVKLFPKQYNDLREWTSDKKVEGYYAKNSENPDLIYAIKVRNENDEYVFNEHKSSYFAVECKFRSNFHNGRVELCLDQQLFRYQEFGMKNEMDVFIVLGLGGFASTPKDLYIIPVEHINRGFLFQNELNNFARIKGNQQPFFYDKNKRQLT